MSSPKPQPTEPKAGPRPAEAAATTPAHLTDAERQAWERSSQIANFTGLLAIARRIWRQHPDLVLLPEIPAEWVAAYREHQADEHPEDYSADYDDAFLSERSERDRLIETIRAFSDGDRRASNL